MKSLLLIPALLLAGCFDSLVSDPCVAGATWQDGRCVMSGPGTVTGTTGDGSGSDGPVGVQPVCTAGEEMCSGVCTDLTSDPLNCGACGNACDSGLCVDSACVGSPLGHVVAIGHDYLTADPAMQRVLGNALALGAHANVGVALWSGSATTDVSAAVAKQITTTLQMVGRSTHMLVSSETPVMSSAIDVLVVAPQTVDGDAEQIIGSAWAGPVAQFLARGGVVIVLDGDGSTSYRWAAGAGLFETGAPVDITGQNVVVMNGSDALASHVVSPYLAKGTSVAYPAVAWPTWPTMTLPAVATTGGAPVAFHFSY